MFERLRTEIPTPTHTAYPVEIRFADGGQAKGRMLVPAGRSLADTLNSPGGFMEFEPYGGEPTFLPKARLAEVRPLGVPKGINLKARLSASEPLNPYAILGLQPGASYEQVRKAYFALVKAYHPDRYATAELPPEVLEYMLTMVRRINAAHAALDGARKAQAAVAAVEASSPATAH